jgi:hypothetical protein
MWALKKGFVIILMQKCVTPSKKHSSICIPLPIIIPQYFSFLNRMLYSIPSEG